MSEVFGKQNEKINRIGADFYDFRMPLGVAVLEKLVFEVSRGMLWASFLEALGVPGVGVFLIDFGAFLMLVASFWNPF